MTVLMISDRVLEITTGSNIQGLMRCFNKGGSSLWKLFLDVISSLL
jgi:hypothetical protein